MTPNARPAWLTPQNAPALIRLTRDPVTELAEHPPNSVANNANLSSTQESLGGGVRSEEEDPVEKVEDNYELAILYVARGGVRK